MEKSMQLVKVGIDDLSPLFGLTKDQVFALESVWIRSLAPLDGLLGVLEEQCEHEGVAMSVARGLNILYQAGVEAFLVALNECATRPRIQE